MVRLTKSRFGFHCCHLGRILGVLGILFVCTIAQAAEWRTFNKSGDLSPAGPTVQIEQPTSDSLKLTFHIPGFYETQRQAQNTRFQQLDFPGEGHLREVGLPALPTVGRLVAVPRGATVTASVNFSDPHHYSQIKVWPAQPSRCRCVNGAQPAFQLESDRYHSTNAFPEQPIQLSGPYRFRDVDLLRVQLNPTVYVAAGSALTVYGTAQVTLTLHRPYGKRLPNDSAIFARAMTTILASDRVLPHERVNGEALGHLLIVAYDEFIPALEEYVAWKRASGWVVSVIPVSEAGGTSEEIKQSLLTAYQTLQPTPDMLLLVGDAAQVPTVVGVDNSDQDFRYGLLDGDDLFPELLTGRLSAQNLEQLTAQLEKLLAYAQTPPTGRQGASFKKGLAISSSQSLGLGENDDERLDRISALLLDHGFESVNKLYHSVGNDTAELIQNAFNQGRGFAIYMGHGNGVEWTTTQPPYNYADVLLLQNAPRVPFVMDVSCTNGAFRQLEPSFAEAWMRHGPHGSVAIYASSTPTAWDESAELGEGVTSSLFNFSQRLGGALLGGMLRLLAAYGDGKNVEDVLSQYVLFGDPTGLIRLSDPLPLEVELPEALPLQTGSEFSLSVLRNGEAAKEVTAVLTIGEAVVVAQGDNAGQVNFTLPVAGDQTADLLITAADALPFSARIPALPVSCGELWLDRTVASCENGLKITLSDWDLNVDSQSVDSVQVWLWTEETPADGDTDSDTDSDLDGDADVDSDSENEDEIDTEVELARRASGAVSFVLTESGEDTGQFSAWLDFNGNDPLPVAHGETFFAGYDDADCDGQTVFVNATAMMDCESPVFTDVELSEIEAESALLSWRTDEATNGLVLVTDENTGDREQLSFVVPVAATEQEVRFQGLTPDTDYSCLIMAYDIAENLSVFNDEPCRFRTLDEAQPEGDGDLERDATEEDIEFVPDGDLDLDVQEREFETEKEGPGDEDEQEAEYEFPDGDEDGTVAGDVDLEIEEAPQSNSDEDLSVGDLDDADDGGGCNQIPASTGTMWWGFVALLAVCRRRFCK